MKGRIEALEQAINLILALHDNPESGAPGEFVRLSPAAEKQLREALEPRSVEPEFEFDMFTGSDGVPVVYVETPGDWDNNDGPQCRVYLNDGDPLWANPDLPH